MRKTTSRTIVALAVAAAAAAVTLVAGAAPAEAQQLEPPRPRQGYYVTLGLYGAASQAREKGDSLGPWGGSGGSLRVGQLVTSRFGLGLTLESGGTKGGGQQASMSALGLEASWAIHGNLAARGGVGIGFMRLHDPNDPTESATRGVAGSWYALGLSYDWFPSKARRSGGFSIAPTVQARLIPGSDTSGFVAFFGVDLGYWTGLPRNQLDLPPSEAWKP
jgi:hypothetical protein